MANGVLACMRLRRRYCCCRYDVQRFCLGGQAGESEVVKRQSSELVIREEKDSKKRRRKDGRGKRGVWDAEI